MTLELPELLAQEAVKVIKEHVDYYSFEGMGQFGKKALPLSFKPLSTHLCIFFPRC